MPSKKEPTSRRFSLVTYLPEQRLKDILSVHSDKIKAWAYAYHDKDTNEKISKLYVFILIKRHSAYKMNKFIFL